MLMNESKELALSWHMDIPLLSDQQAEGTGSPC